MRVLPAMLCLMVALMTGCAYERVDIVTGSDTYNGTILSHYSDVEKTSNGILLKPGARFAIKTVGMTQSLGQFDVVILSGDGMNVYLRTVSHQFDTSRGIAFRYATNGCMVREADGTQVPISYNAETDQQMLSFYNESNLLSISVGCKRLYEEQPQMPQTEYVIFETLPGSSVELRSVAYFDTSVE